MFYFLMCVLASLMKECLPKNIIVKVVVLINESSILQKQLTYISLIEQTKRVACFHNVSNNRYLPSMKERKQKDRSIWKEGKDIAITHLFFLLRPKVFPLQK